ncbi:MAG TPA: head-tail connector protein [Candidatus Dormibacteraeota bacterium]|nr:head-tail connector protein [Candidatus Dormibacteraeota bacterium]
MLTTLDSLKLRLAIADTDVTSDDLLTSVIEAVSARFENETNRTLARAENATFELEADQCEISPPCYPIESVSKLETKVSEAAGWVEQTGIDYLIRQSCLVSLTEPLNNGQTGSVQLSTINPALARITYSGGYVLPGTDPEPGQTPLPADLEHACIEQCAAWFLHRDKVGLEINWPKGGIYQRFVQLPLLPSVSAILKKYQRWSI